MMETIDGDHEGAINLSTNKEKELARSVALLNGDLPLENGDSITPIVQVRNDIYLKIY